MPRSKLSRSCAARGALVLLACTLVTLGTPYRASAQITPTEAKCRSTIAKLGGKYTKAATKAVIDCHKARSAGKIGAEVDCNVLADADFKHKAEKAEAKLRAGVAGEKGACDTGVPEQTNVLAQFGRCPEPAETIDDGGATDGIDDFGELLDCMVEHTRLITEDRAANVFGMPAAPLSADLQKCQQAIGKGYAKVINATVKERSKCQADLDKTGGPVGFDCATEDSGKITKAASSARAGIAKACGVVSIVALSRGARASISDLDSCATDLDALQSCAIDDAATNAGSGITSMLWELPGICPGSGESFQVLPVLSDTELDTGWNGYVHDMDPILGYRGVVFSIACDPDCNNCGPAYGGVHSPVGACRCSDDATVLCQAPGADPACAGECQCFYGPPTPYVGASTPACVQTLIDGPMTGGLDPNTGDIDFGLSAKIRIHIGITYESPCPQCVANVCVGGQRNGLPCSVDATDATFGPVSYDCPPSTGLNVSGAGQHVSVSFTTGNASLPFGTECGGFLPPGIACACGVCSGDENISCNSNADCTGIGTCGNHSFAPGRFPNACNDGMCSPDVEAGEGTCLAGPVDQFCDGFVRSNGLGIIQCLNNADCDAQFGLCNGGSCGACTISKNRDCFLDPITATGIPGQTMVGVGCMGASNNAGVNGAIGWPGAYRVRENIGNFATDAVLCSDGATPYIPPGGSNCP